eukprot:629921-Rhodomonas_salina.1
MGGPERDVFCDGKATLPAPGGREGGRGRGRGRGRGGEGEERGGRRGEGRERHWQGRGRGGEGEGRGGGEGRGREGREGGELATVTVGVVRPESLRGGRTSHVARSEVTWGHGPGSGWDLGKAAVGLQQIMHWHTRYTSFQVRCGWPVFDHSNFQGEIARKKGEWKKAVSDKVVAIVNRVSNKLDRLEQCWA